jgi:CheY-like chemotaxis protein
LAESYESGGAILRVLIVDDDAAVRKILIAALKRFGFEAVGVQDALSAMRELNETSEYDLAIVDLYMPKIDGVKLIKALREQAPEFPIIAMSGVLLNKSQHTALQYFPHLPELSDVVCLEKPFRSLDLLKAVQKALAATLEAESSEESAIFNHEMAV